MADDAAVLLGHAREEAGDVLEDHERDVEGVAEAHEARALVGGVDVEHARQNGRLVRDHTHRMSAEVGEPDDQIAREARVHLVELTPVDHPSDDLMHVVGMIGVIRYELE